MSLGSAWKSSYTILLLSGKLTIPGILSLKFTDYSISNRRTVSNNIMECFLLEFVFGDVTWE